MDRTTLKLTPAMAALIQQADEKIDYQQWPEAVVVLERALRINPKQAEAWTRMAVVYLGKLQPEQAIQMARKSNALASSDNALKSYNWTLMSRAYEQLDQTDKASHAAEQSRQYEQGRR
ncbi:MAG: tetratricopeptide repeat protein [Gammaproteobacteria bacterium]|nr:tetratricopeptide repeat protein [Gammaproteobacteria bacterium]